MPIQTLTIPIARNGLNKDLEPSDLVGHFSPNMKNMQVRPSKMTKRLGYSTFGRNLPLSGIGSELVEYVDARGATHLIALTTTMVYEYDATSQQWIAKLTGTQMQDCELAAEWAAGADITVSLNTNDQKEGSGCIKMTAGDDIAAGAKIGSSATFDDSDDLSDYGAIAHVSFWFRASKANVQITVHVKDADSDIEALSFVAAFAERWYHVTKEVDLSGIDTATSLEIDTETALVDTDWIEIDDIRACGSFTGANDNRWSHGVATDANLFTNNGGSALIISNGVDSLSYYEGHTLGKFELIDMTDFASFANTKEIVEFWNHFFCLNFNNGAQNVRSLAFADFGDIDDYTGGTSGSSVLTDSKGAIVRAKKLGADLIIYSDKSITTGRYLGLQFLFAFPTLVFETGLFAPKGIWDFVNVHYFLGTDQKIYGYSGGRELHPIGKAIETSLFAELDASKKLRAVAGLDVGRHKLYFLIPTVSDTYAKTYYALNHKMQNLPWEYGRFAHDVRDFSVFENAVDWYCDDDERKDLYCDEQSFYCDFAYAIQGYPISVFISSAGYTYQLDETASDGGENIEALYDTEEISIDMEYSHCRWNWFAFIAKADIASSTIKVYYSISDGAVWGDWVELDDSPVSLTSTWTTHRVSIDILARKIRFRFYQNSQKDIQIRTPLHVECSKDTPQD